MRALPEGVASIELGSFSLKDLPYPEHLFQLVVPEIDSEFPALRTVGGTPHNLPQLVNSFVGRAAELTSVRARLDDSRLVTLTGPAGTGKTRLALEVGSQVITDFPDGVWLTELASLADPRAIWQSLAAALRLHERTGMPPMTAVLDHLRHQVALVVLDNCEHIAEASAEVCESLLRECPRVKVLATSRRPLSLSVERVHHVSGLAVPELVVPAEDALAYGAVELLVDRARERNPEFTPTEDTVEALIQICSQLDGIPLAIELAAARIHVLGPREVATRLDDRFSLLTRGTGDSLPHHQTLRVALDWSYDLLTPDEASVLRRLSVFAGGFSLSAVESVCADDRITEASIVDLLQDLVEQSLVVVHDAAPDVRYRMLETVRIYATEKLNDSRNATEAFRAHGRFYMRLVENAEPVLQGLGDASQVDVLDALDRDHDNFRAAMKRMLETDPDIAGRLAAALWRFWEIRGYLNEGSEWLDQTLSASAGARTVTRSKALFGAGKLAWRRGAFERAEPLFRECLGIWREIGNRDGEADALHGLARAALNLRDPAAAQTWGEEALTIQKELNSKQGIATAINTLGEIARFRGDFTEAEARYIESLRIFEEIGDTAAAITEKHNLGYTALAQNRIDAAEMRFDEGLAVARDLHDHLGIFSILGGLAGVAVANGNAKRAVVLFSAAHTLATDGYAGDRIDQLEVEGNLAEARAALETAEFQSHWELGQEMARADAIAYALRE